MYSKLLDLGLAATTTTTHNRARHTNQRATKQAESLAFYLFPSTASLQRSSPGALNLACSSFSELQRARNEHLIDVPPPTHTNKRLLLSKLLEPALVATSTARESHTNAKGNQPRPKLCLLPPRLPPPPHRCKGQKSGAAFAAMMKIERLNHRFLFTHTHT